MPELTIDDRSDIQGIIFSGYGHLPHTLYLFIQVLDAAKARQWLGQLIPTITTGKPWRQNADGSRAKPEAACNIAFTHPGFRALGLPQHTLETFSREFSEGMAEPHRSLILGDTDESSPDHWDIGGPQTDTVHLLLILNGSSLDQLQDWQTELFPDSDRGVKLVASESGRRPPKDKEHFGFRDSIAQPIVEGFPTTPPADDQPVVRTGEFVLGYLNQFDFFPASPAVPSDQDPGDQLSAYPDAELPGFKDFGHHGAYLVYRKLSQNVAAFWNFVAQNEQDAEGRPDAPAMTKLASKFVGRWPSGTPLVLAPEQDDLTIANPNKFTYLPIDREGLACPVGAHLRRTNPRDSFLDISPEESLKTSSQHRLIRRGRVYGEPLFPLDDVEKGQPPVEIQDDGQPRGLHFVCLNSEIGRQFEFVQQTWANNPRFNTLYDNRDPIIGNNDGSSHMTIPEQPVRRRILGMPRFVIVRGGGYFFLPSIKALCFLANTT
ncbi:MAG: hypothetical protein MJA27_28055 [Pseudanabaenales cyanobacterium]|nr:hypothetical protein [Pseudanabaenales cyanobacterium]